MREPVKLSTLPKTWLFDLDGTLLKHNGYLQDGEDTLLPGAAEFLASIPREDTVILLTSRKEAYAKMTINFLQKHAIRYDHILFNLPPGERMLVNDKKPSGLDMAYSINVDRNAFEIPCFQCCL